MFFLLKYLFFKPKYTFTMQSYLVKTNILVEITDIFNILLCQKSVFYPNKSALNNWPQVGQLMGKACFGDEHDELLDLEIWDRKGVGRVAWRVGYCSRSRRQDPMIPPPPPYKNLECRVNIGNWNVDRSTTGSGGGGSSSL